MANIGEPMRRHHVIPLDHPIPAIAEPNPSSLAAIKPETQPSESPRIRAGEIIGWRFWRLCNGLLNSVYVPYTWRPGVFERSSAAEIACCNPGYHAFRDKERAELKASMHVYWSPLVIGSVAMWGEVIEHQYGWRSEYAAVRSITKITGDISFWSKQRSLLDLGEKYGCPVLTEL